MAVSKVTLITELQESVNTAPVTTEVLLATKTSSTGSIIRPSTLLTSVVQEHPSNILLPTGVHYQIPASQVQQQGDGTAQYSLTKGQIVVAVLVLAGVGKVIEHLGKKVWNAIGMSCSFHFFKCLRNLYAA